MDITSIDKEILMFIQTNIRCNFLTPIMKAITYLGNSGLIWIIITLLLLMFKKTRKIGILSAIALIENLLICNVFLKQIIKRMRPYDRFSDLTRIIAKQSDYSFPSGNGYFQKWRQEDGDTGFGVGNFDFGIQVICGSSLSLRCNWWN